MLNVQRRVIRSVGFRKSFESMTVDCMKQVSLHVHSSHFETIALHQLCLDFDLESKNVSN